MFFAVYFEKRKIKILNKLFPEYHNIILLPDYAFGVIDEVD